MTSQVDNDVSMDSELEHSTTNGLFDVRKQLEEQRDNSDVVHEFIKSNKHYLRILLRNLHLLNEKFCSQVSLHSLSQFVKQEFNYAEERHPNNEFLITHTLSMVSLVLQDKAIKITELYQLNKDSKLIYSFDDLSQELAVCEIFIHYLKNLNDASSDNSQSSTLLKPYKDLLLKYTTPDNYLIAAFIFCEELNSSSLSLALIKTKTAYQRILKNYALVSQIYDAAKTIEIKRNCPLRRKYDAVKWQKKEIQKICFDLMLIEEDIELEINAQTPTIES